MTLQAIAKQLRAAHQSILIAYEMDDADSLEYLDEKVVELRQDAHEYGYTQYQLDLEVLKLMKEENVT